MIPVPDALELILQQVPSGKTETLSIYDCLGYVLANDVDAKEPLPPFRASIMDGYAVLAADGPGTYPVYGSATAGLPIDTALSPGQVVYITTGAPVPAGADAVVMVEETTPQDNGTVKIIGTVSVGDNIRPIGCDIAVGQTVLTQGQVLGPAEIGLLATVGLVEALVWSKPRVGIISTGDELVDAKSILGPGQIRDSNRPMLLAAVQQAEALPVDFGIVADKETQLETRFMTAISECDICILSGGVSMGLLDLVKPMLQRLGMALCVHVFNIFVFKIFVLGTVHFGRLLMKPGKPSTFATIDINGSKKLVFGLPGNPVSCLATFNLLVKPAIRKLSGLEVVANPRLQVRMQESIKLDPVRPEYHRATVFWDARKHEFVAFSTGSQASSRLMSFANANALVEIKSGSGVIPSETCLYAQIIGPLQPPNSIESARDAQRARLSTPPSAKYVCNCDRPRAVEEKENQSALVPFDMRVGILVVSDRCSRGQMQDRTTPIATAFFNNRANFPADVSVQIAQLALIPDDAATISRVLSEWADMPSSPHFIITSGGTGFSPRDNTPEATRAVLDREAPGLVHFIIAESFKHTSMASLMRPVAGTRKRTVRPSDFLHDSCLIFGQGHHQFAWKFQSD